MSNFKEMFWLSSFDQVRKVLRQKFEENKNVTDLRQIDAIIFKGELELEESQKGWMQGTHICRYMEMTKAQQPKSKDFLDKFYSGDMSWKLKLKWQYLTCNLLDLFFINTEITEPCFGK